MFFSKPRWLKLMPHDLPLPNSTAIGQIEKYRKALGAVHETMSALVAGCPATVKRQLIKLDRTIAPLEPNLPERDRWTKILRLWLERKLKYVQLDTPTSWVRGALREITFSQFATFLEMVDYAVEIERR